MIFVSMSKDNIIIESIEQDGTVKAGMVLSTIVRSMGDHITFEAMRSDFTTLAGATVMYKQNKFKVVRIEDLMHKRIRVIAIPD